MDNRALVREAGTATSAERLAELAKHPDPSVRRALARNGHLGRVALETLLADEAWEVRTVAAHHKDAPRERALEILGALASSAEAEQRAVAARSPLTPVDTLVRLASDADVETRANALRNPRTPGDVVRAHLTEAEPGALMGALAHPSITKAERRAFVTEELLARFFETHADGDHLFEALCERYLWDVLERAFADPERFDDVWNDLVSKHFELVEVPSRGAVLAAVGREHWPAVIRRLADEVRGSERRPD